MSNVCIIGEADPFIARLLQQFADKSGLQSVRAQAGQDVPELVRRFNPNVILLDPELPGKLRGWEVACALNSDAQTAAVPIVTCAWLSEADARVLIPSAVGYLQKPDLHYDDFVIALGKAGIGIKTQDEPKTPAPTWTLKGAGTMAWTTEPLTQEEREEFRQLFERRLEKVKAKTADVFAFKPTSQPPFMVNSALYWVFGLDPELFPDNYFDDPAVMTTFQERTYYDQVKKIDDDFVPYLMPWFGTVAASSALGCKIQYPPKQDPAADPRYYPVQSVEDVKRLQIPDPEKDGLMPKVLEFLRYMKGHSFLPVGITDFQGPLTTANQLMGYDKLIYLMYDYPDVMHELMDKVTDTLILWVKKQKEVIGEPLDYCISDQQVYTGEHAGVWFSDDDAVLMSVNTYREFVVPYNSRILKAFGGGCIHYCGNATHHAESFLATEGLRALNIYNLYNLRSVAELQRKVQGRIVLFVCDFTPVEYEEYFQEMMSTLDRAGIIICSQYSPVVGLLKGGKYSPIRRDLKSGRKAVYEYLRNCLTQ